jgi:hypothetical protein
MHVSRWRESNQDSQIFQPALCVWTAAIAVLTDEYVAFSLAVQGQPQDAALDVVPPGQRCARSLQWQLDDLPLEVNTMDTHKAGDCQL